MTEYIVLSKYDVLSLKSDRPVFIWVDGKCYVLCTDEYFENLKRDMRGSTDETNC